MSAVTADGGQHRGARIVSIRADGERDFTSNVGMVVFLASWAMMFGALFFSYALLRLRSPSWPPVGVPALPFLLPAVNTLVLILSSVTYHCGERAVRRGREEKLPFWLGATIALGSLFMILQAVVWVDLWQGGLTLQSSTYSSVFYLLTTFHALHVLVGLGFLVGLVPAAVRRAFSPKKHSRVHVVGMFWHFVDVVWFLIFVSVYLP